jgi:hypothetical protein
MSGLQKDRMWAALYRTGVRRGILLVLCRHGSSALRNLRRLAAEPGFKSTSYPLQQPSSQDSRKDTDWLLASRLTSEDEIAPSLGLFTGGVSGFGLDNHCH